MSWQHVKVGDLITQVRGVSYSSGDAVDEYKDGYVELLRANNIADGHLNFNDVTYVPKSKVTEKQYLKQNDIVIAASSGSISVVGKAASFNVNRASTFGAFCKVLRPNANVDARYIANYFQTGTYRRTVSALAEGANINNLRNEHIDNLDILLPPLAEQKRIAAILDKAAEIKIKREQAIAKLDELAQSTFVEMFGDVVANDKGWQCVTLGSVTSKLGSGATPSGGDASYKAEGIPLIRSLNVHDGEFVYKNLAYIDDEQAQKLSNVIVQKNDVLLNITGASVARVCRVPDAVVPARVNQHVMIVRPTEKINPIFLERQLLTACMKQKLLQVGGAGATREAITKAQATELNVICPPIAAQTKFADIAKWIERLKAQEVTGLVSLEKLTSSLQHQAFTTGFAA